MYPKICLKIAHLQVPTDQSSLISSMITITLGLFKYICLQFSLICSSTIFRDVMNKVVDDLSDVNKCHDDVLVHDPDDLFTA